MKATLGNTQPAQKNLRNFVGKLQPGLDELTSQTAIRNGGKLLLFLLLVASSLSAQPLRLLPQNPHYFQFKGKPTVLVGSGEHYGAVINQDFDYKTYLQTLGRDGLNITRVFTGAYFEKQGAFGIAKNTLAPSPDRLILPWSRSTQPGFALGGNKFDLNRWNDAYFTRLKDFMREAERNNVVVEITLFSSYYGAGWAHSPFNRDNNISYTDDINPLDVNTPNNGNILAFQEEYVRKIVRELNGFDNLYYEIQNEPWADLKDTVLTLNEYFPAEDMKTGQWRAALEVVAQRANDWQRRVAEWITEEEAKLPKKHLISQNIGNFRYPITDPDPNVSIFNFHYAHPEAVTMNYHLNKVIGFNETGFAGSNDHTYRRQAWRFMLAGGGLFNHLDYSFSVGAEQGQDTAYQAPGGGSPRLRQHFALLKQFLESLDLPRLRPDASLVKAAPGLMHTQTLTNQTNQFIVYAESVSPRTTELVLTLPRGTYTAQWMDTATGQIEQVENFTHGHGEKRVTFPKPLADMVLRIQKQ
ncbi:hypothetical protein [Nibrella viscosa]|uniref:hypothetical protein n=1 Tax=Nibrella viscosa TaxID=1084524 RepID=UPI0031EBFFD8